MKSNKGITLVALVITIIVLLILAGVSISMVVGENGVLNRATGAATETSEAEMKQALEMAVDGAQGEFIDIWTKNTSLDIIDCIVGSETASPDKTKQVQLKADGYCIEVSGTGTTRTVKIDKGEASGTISADSKTAKTATLTQTDNGVGLTLTWAD